MRSNGSGSRGRSPGSFIKLDSSGLKQKEPVTKRLKNLIEALKKKSPVQSPKDISSKSELDLSKSQFFKKTDQSFIKFVSTLKTSQQPTSQSAIIPTIEELRAEKSQLLAEKDRLETILKKTKVERLFWKEKVIDLEKRIDKRLKSDIEEKESRSQSRELRDSSSKSHSVLFVRTYTSSKDGQKVLNTDISFS